MPLESHRSHGRAGFPFPAYRATTPDASLTWLDSQFGLLGVYALVFWFDGLVVAGAESVSDVVAQECRGDTFDCVVGTFGEDGGAAVAPDGGQVSAFLVAQG